MSKTKEVKDAVKEYCEKNDISKLYAYFGDIPMLHIGSKKQLQERNKSLMENVRDLTNLVLDEQHAFEILDKENKELKTEMAKKDRELTTLKILFKEFYQSVFDKAEQSKNLWAGFTQHLDNISAETLNIEYINSLVAESKERKLTDHQVREALKKEGVLVKRYENKLDD